MVSHKNASMKRDPGKWLKSIRGKGDWQAKRRSSPNRGQENFLVQHLQQKIQQRLDNGVETGSPEQFQQAQEDQPQRQEYPQS